MTIKVENIVAKGEIALVTMFSKSCLLQRRQKAYDFRNM